MGFHSELCWKARWRRRVGPLVWGGAIAAFCTFGASAGSVEETAAAVIVGAHASADATAGFSCLSCHQVDPTFSHPVGFTPGRQLPSQFPLEQGRLTCVTCHDAEPGDSHASGRAGSENLLRTDSSGIGLCIQCHEYTPGSFGSSHATAVDRAHLRWPDERPDRRVGTGLSASFSLDSESATCLGCHDGSLASDVDSRPDSSMFSTSLGRDHPVGVPYTPAKHRGRLSPLVHPAALDWRIRLYDGAVGCGSCHSVYSGEPMRLVMSNLGSALCLSCHEDG